jgi:hypothetical protein
VGPSALSHAESVGDAAGPIFLKSNVARRRSAVLTDSGDLPEVLDNLRSAGHVALSLLRSSCFQWSPSQARRLFCWAHPLDFRARRRFVGSATPLLAVHNVDANAHVLKVVPSVSLRLFAARGPFSSDNPTLRKMQRGCIMIMQPRAQCAARSVQSTFGRLAAEHSCFVRFPPEGHSRGVSFLSDVPPAAAHNPHRSLCR